MMSVGFIGLGIMGRPMAAHVLAVGHPLFVYARRGLPEGLSSSDAVLCGSSREVAEKADVLITMLPDTPQVDEVLFGTSGVAEGLKPGKIVVDMSSVSPAETVRFARQIEALGSDFLDAPVSGGEVGARNASLTIMVGGKYAIFEKIKPILDLMGTNVSWIGGAGAGQIAKCANQMIVALTIQAVGEALLLSARAGADPERVRAALMGGFASSRVLEVHGERMVRRTFDPGFRIELHQKDLRNALSTAQHLGVPMPGTATAQELLTACIAQGLASRDHSGLVCALEKLANFEIAAHGAVATAST
jgi:2-hydroxy-3-oxopropionate reductase